MRASAYRAPVAALIAVAVLALAAAPGSGAATSSLTSAYLAYGTATASVSSQPQVWALGIGTASELLGPGQEPLLSPDGTLVAASLSASSDSGSSLAIYSVAGAPAHAYGNLASATAEPLAWSADAKYLAVALDATSVGDAQARDSSLAVIEAQTGAVRTIAHGFVQGASFAPGGSDELAFGLTQSFTEGAAVNIHVVDVDGSHARLLTHDGHCLNPVWGSVGIAYDRERPRHLQFPVYEIWLLSPRGGHARQLTHVKVGALVSGLVPLAFSATASRLLAEFEGQDTSAAWTVNVDSGHARELTTPGRHSLQGAGISKDGATVLVDEDSLQSPPSAGRIVTVPFGGGTARVLVAHGAQASWNE